MVARALKKYGIVAGIELKWPNDILFAGRKLAGILLASSAPKNGEIAIVIGIGLNLQLPEEHQTQWIDLAEITGKKPARNFMAGLLVNELLAGLAVYAQRGFAAFVDAWRLQDVLRNKEIIVHTPTQTIAGLMQGINEQGELLLQDASGGLLRFQCGDVSIRIK